jgi:hypothetical protein
VGVLGKLPATAPPTVVKASMSDEDAVEIQRRSLQYRQETRQVTTYVPVQEVRETTVKKDGRDVRVQYTVTKQVPVVQQVVVQVAVAGPSVKAKVAAKDCKFFIVTREGKLEKVEAARAATLLKKPTQVLSGESAEVDPRHLELIRAGTLYLVVPQSQPNPRAPRPLPEVPRNRP